MDWGPRLNWKWGEKKKTSTAPPFISLCSLTVDRVWPAASHLHCHAFPARARLCHLKLWASTSSSFPKLFPDRYLFHHSKVIRARSCLALPVTGEWGSWCFVSLLPILFILWHLGFVFAAPGPPSDLQDWEVIGWGKLILLALGISLCVCILV